MPRSHASVRRLAFVFALVAAFVGARVGLEALTGPLPGSQADELRIAVVQGGDSVNFIQQRAATATIVEVRDRNNLPVAGASVLFRLGGRAGTASLNGGAPQVRLTTNAAGRASVTVNPLSPGAVQLQVRATYQSQTADTTITQTNVQTAAQAGRSPTSSGESAKTRGALRTTTAGAGRATATTAGGASGTGRRLSTLAIAGIAGGAAGGFVAYKKITANQPPTLTSISASPSTVLAGASTPVAFSAQASDPDNDSLVYSWEFGDGGTADTANPTHTYTATSAQAFTVKLTVTDGKDPSAPQQTTVTVRTLDGTWRSTGAVGGAWQMTLPLSQSGAAVTGSIQIVGTNAATQFVGTFTSTTAAGLVRTSTPRVSLRYPAPRAGTLVWASELTFALDPGPDVSSLTGTVTDSTATAAITLNRQ